MDQTGWNIILIIKLNYCSIILQSRVKTRYDEEAWKNEKFYPTGELKRRFLKLLIGINRKKITLNLPGSGT